MIVQMIRRSIIYAHGVAISLSPVVECSGSNRERGRAQGEALRDRIEGVLERWGMSAATRTGTRPERYVDELLAASDFLPAISRETPGLVDELEGIAEAAHVNFRALLALNLLDEEWWHATDRGNRPACSVVAVPAGLDHGPLLAQNMDLPVWTDGAQAIVRHLHPDGLRTLVLTVAGMVGLTGVSSSAVGVCVNALSMLRHSPSGLPVAFALRGALERRSAAAAAAFLRAIPHASGQHYAVVDPATTAALECSAGGAVEVAGDGPRWHTNHPLASDDVDPYAAEPGGAADSHVRGRRLAGALPAVTGPADCRRLLADRDAPLSVHATPERPWLTFGSVVYELAERPRAWIAPGPPDHVPFAEHRV
jgi:isopenicillin-N N-acyltransferase like protein